MFLFKKTIVNSDMAGYLEQYMLNILFLLLIKA